MLYDPKWEKQTETKADPFSLQTLIAWLEKQRPRDRYDYRCNGHCLLAQYFTAIGFDDVCMGSESFDHAIQGQRVEIRLPSRFNDIAISQPRTFGGALSRARDALKTA